MCIIFRSASWRWCPQRRCWWGTRCRTTWSRSGSATGTASTPPSCSRTQRSSLLPECHSLLIPPPPVHCGHSACTHHIVLRVQLHALGPSRCFFGDAEISTKIWELRCQNLTWVTCVCVLSGPAVPVRAAQADGEVPEAPDPGGQPRLHRRRARRHGARPPQDQARARDAPALHAHRIQR